MNGPATLLAFERPGRSAARPRLVIGLLNNMPDAALQATERQFGGLLRAAAGAVAIELRLFSLPEVERGERARRHMRGLYADARALPGAGLDGLIVTGAEPRAPRLADEPYWGSLTRVMDWTREAGIPTVWSCLAAHAAALHQGGVERRPLAAKLSGVFACQPAGDDPLAAGLPDFIATPHSRQNELRERDLTAAGYRILTRSPLAGVDSFVGPGRALALFCQGHPEYDADTLMREYLRDVGRFLRGERPMHPAIPSGYFPEDAERALAELAKRAERRGGDALLADYAAVVEQAAPDQVWRPAALRLFGGWLGRVEAQARPARRAPLASTIGGYCEAEANVVVGKAAAIQALMPPRYQKTLS